MPNEIVILGYGPVGRATVAALLAKGRAVRVAQRSRPADLAAAVPFTPCDVLDARSVRTAIEGAAQVAVAIGFEYLGAVWEKVWPVAMQNLLDACAAENIRMVFLDNLYMYGPQHAPLVETMPLSDRKRKPAARARITRMWQQDRRVRVAALRAPDFYGPGVLLSHVGETGLAAIARGKAASFVFPPDQPHDFAYIPDIGRAMVSLLDADDAAFGQVWHMPCAPTLTSRQILAMGARAAGVPLKLRNIPPFLLDMLAPFVPFLRELREMRFQWDRPYRVDAAKWKARFWSDATPFETGVAATIASFRG
ncbi:NAD-dependent epimerase/dehydratase family protein [Sphingomonas psychrolutea]|uniref:Epimerase n=1 Tax=Sphingomonas psychrolutea TaxID=1259676 RepID=A0ABQ1H0E3_9SPHN|nr:NAD-dependent epimerase/dehydratase family protein [Sphingomonas psychrolutea]GGA53635.1 epimerase [Sphingomonas psychrolutea]